MIAVGPRKTVVIGLDSVPPKILYEDLKGELPNIESILNYKGEILTSHPPITVPAWAVMVTGMSAGALGIYGFRHRRPGDVQASYVVTSRSVPRMAIWDVLGSLGYRSMVVGVPPSYPPRPIKGYMVSCFLTPDTSKQYTWPPSLKREVEAASGGYMLDVEFRIRDKDKIKRGLWELAVRQFTAFKYLVRNKEWDFAMYMHIGTDRVHHAFWKFYDKGHPRYPGEGNPYEDVIPDYYRLIDRLIGELLEVIPRNAQVFIVSDHGAKAMKGAFAINQWLEQEGYLKLKEKPGKPGVDLSREMIDWGSTIAWAWGGYYSRVFINLKGREPRGIVGREEYEDVVKQLKNDIEKIRGPNGEKWDNKAYTPQELYGVARGDAPDLMVYLDNLDWRPAGTVGWPDPYLEENDRGPDDAVHDWIGVIGGNSPLLKEETHKPMPIIKFKELVLNSMDVQA